MSVLCLLTGQTARAVRDDPALADIVPRLLDEANGVAQGCFPEVKRVTRAEAASTQAGKPADAADVGLFKGTMEALEQVSIEKGCNIEFQHG